MRISFCSLYEEGKDRGMLSKYLVSSIMMASLAIHGICLSQTASKTRTLSTNGDSELQVTVDQEERSSTDSDVKNSLAKSPNSTYILSSQTPDRSTSAVVLYDFTTGSDKYYGTTSAAKELETNVWGMISGDASGNGEVQADDKESYWRVEVGLSGYKASDFNLNGEVQADDKESYWRVNVGRGSQVP